MDVKIFALLDPRRLTCSRHSIGSQFFKYADMISANPESYFRYPFKFFTSLFRKPFQHIPVQCCSFFPQK